MSFDIAIIGAGPAGLAFACSLADTGLRIVMVERLSADELADPPVDGRDIALTHLSKQILERLGIWQRFPAGSVSPIREARVVDGTSPYTLNFDSAKDDFDALGYLVSNHLIRKALYEATEELEHVELITDTSVTATRTDDDGGSITLSDGRTLDASLIVAADTRFSDTRRKMGIAADLHDFGRTAIVCWMEHELPHHNIAYECFHYGRTLAVLPMPNNTSSIVITVPTSLADSILAMDEDHFNADIRQRFGNRLGGMKLVGKRHPYPLVAVHADRFAAKRFALVGDAAVGMHPVTAHGFNLGLSGADILASEIKKALDKGRDFGADTVLQRYQSKHMQTTRPLFHGTNGIVSLFTNDALPAKLARKAVMRLSNNLPPVKWLIKNKLTSRSHSGGLVLPFPIP